MTLPLKAETPEERESWIQCLMREASVAIGLPSGDLQSHAGGHKDDETVDNNTIFEGPAKKLTQAHLAREFLNSSN